MAVRWGVAGPGAIATSFAQGMTMADGGEITAIASRSIERADAYADRFGITARYAAYEGEGLRFEVEEVHRCLAEGLTESPVMSLDETVAIAGVLDDIRGQIGVVYPGE
jgi:hypothetical protein